MSIQLSLLLLSALAVWLVGADLTVTSIDRDPLLWVRWYCQPRRVRILLALIAWPMVAGIAALIIIRWRAHG